MLKLFMFYKKLADGFRRKAGIKAPAANPKERQRKEKMNIEQYLEEAQRNFYQPYYACFCYCFDYPLGDLKSSDYINWIGARHRNFAPQSSYPPSSNHYFQEFIAYLKKYVTDNRLKNIKAHSLPEAREKEVTHA